MDPHFQRKVATHSPPVEIGRVLVSNAGIQSGSDVHLNQYSDGGGGGGGLRLVDSPSSGPSLGLEKSSFSNYSSSVMLECAKSLLESPESSGLMQELISESTTRVEHAPSTTTSEAINSSYLIELSTFESLFSSSVGGDDSTSGLFNFSNSQINGVGGGAGGNLSSSAAATLMSSTNQVIRTSSSIGDNYNYLNLSKLSELLSAIESPYQLEALNFRWQIFLVIIYSLTAITSFLLNMITVVVLSRCERTELRKYLINLSLSDLLMSLFSIPFTYTEYMLGYWLFFSSLCPIVRFVVTLSVFVSIATMTVIGMNRHMAIMYPLKRRNNSKFRRWRKTHVIVGIWLLGVAISLPEYLSSSAIPFCYNRQLYYGCQNTWPEYIANSYTIFLYLCTFAIPLVLLSYLYTAIGLKLWRRQMPGNVDANRDLTMQSKRAKVFKMLLVVVVLFAVFWLPLQTFTLITYVYPEIRSDFEHESLPYYIFISTYFLCHWLSMAHSCLNPLVYCFMNEKFRTDLRNLFLCNSRSSHMCKSGGGGGTLCKSAIYERSLHLHSSTSGATLRAQNKTYVPPTNGDGGGAGPGGGDSCGTHTSHHSGGARRGSWSNGSSVRIKSQASARSVNSTSAAQRRLSKNSKDSFSSLRKTNSRPLSPGENGISNFREEETTKADEGEQQQNQLENRLKANTDIEAGERSEEMDKLIEQRDKQAGPELSADSTAQGTAGFSVKVTMSNGGGGILFAAHERPTLVSRMSETSACGNGAADTLHEINEEEEEDDEDEYESDDDRDTTAGMKATLKQDKERQYVILESKQRPVVSEARRQSTGSSADRHIANV